MPPVKHIPGRTCIACGKIQPKRNMIRLVRVTENSIEVDSTGKKSGRGAYLCRTADCWNTGLKGNRVERALKTSLVKAERDKLIQELKELCVGENQQI
ncbi:MAG: YlxR family protein [Dehalococcoidales bacterium]|nr:YlxR family protein [Dehalococcoidales bacterium]